MLKSAVIPCLRYRDAPAAIEWLVSVFGFEKHLVVPDDKGGIAHMQLHARVLAAGGKIVVAIKDEADWRRTRLLT